MFGLSLSAPIRKWIVAVVFVMALSAIVVWWEVRGLVELQQHLNEACRDGACQASPGGKSSEQIKHTVAVYLQNKGLSNVTEEDVSIASNSYHVRKGPADATGFDQYRVTVAVPCRGIRCWVLSQFAGTDTLTAYADWHLTSDASIAPVPARSTVPLK